MASKELEHILIIGTGNVASHLAKELAPKVKSITIYGRNQQEARNLSLSSKGKFIEKLDNLEVFDLILVSITDTSISEVIQSLPLHLNIAYTSGSVSLDEFNNHTNIGVFYPLQTFSKTKAVNLFEVPFLIESNNQFFMQQLMDLAWKVSKNVSYANSFDRMRLHLAAVFINNFTNHLSYISNTYLNKEGLNPELLQPLLKETIAKLETQSPFNAQTGPARRGDKSTIQKHLSLLEGKNKDIYELLSASILETYSNEEHDKL
jgi:predicted short-subunit dehydrogenase-like oxidoreductase (DUF2520 family)